MRNRLSETTGVVFMMVLFFVGCEQSTVSNEGDMAVGLDPNTISPPSGFAAQAFEAAGGLEAWTKAKKFSFDCVVTFYEPEGSFYLTQQHYDVYPWGNTIEISGREPKSEYAWRYSNRQLNVSQTTGQIDKFPPNLERLCFTQAILTIAAAPVSLLETSTRFNRQDAAVKKEGKWYYPIHKIGELSGETVFYQNRDTLLVDMVRVPCIDTDMSLIVRGYDYQKIEREGPLMPGRIEIFSTDVSGILQKRLVKVDCYTMAQTK